VNVNAQNKGGTTALMLAVRKGHKESVALLLAVDGADVNAQIQCGDTALTLAAWKNHKACVMLLLAVDSIAVNAQNKNGDTPLIEAAGEGHTMCAEALMGAGADMDAGNKHGSTALMMAAKHGRGECVVLLANAGAHPGVRTHAGGVTARGLFAARLITEENKPERARVLDALVRAERWRTRRGLAIVREQRRIARDKRGRGGVARR